MPYNNHVDETLYLFGKQPVQRSLVSSSKNGLNPYFDLFHWESTPSCPHSHCSISNFEPFYSTPRSSTPKTLSCSITLCNPFLFLSCYCCYYRQLDGQSKYWMDALIALYGKILNETQRCMRSSMRNHSVSVTGKGDMCCNRFFSLVIISRWELKQKLINVIISDKRRCNSALKK